jgi:hypothetical protein
LSQREYSVREGVALSTLSLYLRRARAAVAPEGTRLIPVQVLGGATLVLVQSSGMRIEVGAGFDPDTLRRLLEALEA